MKHASASALLVSQTVSDLDRLVVHQATVIDKLKAERDRVPGSYRISADDIRQIALAIRELEAGDSFGLRRLEDLMNEIRPDWRQF